MTMSWVPPENGGVRDKLAFDFDDPRRAEYAIATLLTQYPEIFVRRSSSRRGYHVVVDTPHDLVVRWMLRDCYGRWTADLKRGKRGIPQNILAGYKNKKFATRWVKVRAIDLKKYFTERAERLVDLELKRAEMFEKCMEART